MTSPLAASLITLTHELVRFSSTESRPEERALCFAHCRRFLAPIPGIEIREVESRGFGTMVALPQGVVEPRILLTGHLDVIEHSGDVYHARVGDGRIWGPGAGDMKGQCAILLQLFATLHQRRPGISLGLALTSDEERGGEDGVQFLFDTMGLRCSLALLPDGGSLNAVTVEEKGILQLRLCTEGSEGHAAAPWLVVNPLAVLVKALGALGEHFDGLQDASSADHWYPTCAPTICHTPNLSVNCIPGAAEAVVDIRFPAPHTPESMLAAVQGIIGPGVRAILVASAVPTHLAPDRLYVSIAEQMTGQPVRLVRASGGSDALFMARHGIPVVLSSPIVGQLHRLDEWIDVASMETYYRICERFIVEKVGSGVGEV